MEGWRDKRHPAGQWTGRGAQSINRTPFRLARAHANSGRRGIVTMKPKEETLNNDEGDPSWWQVDDRPPVSTSTASASQQGHRGR